MGKQITYKEPYFDPFTHKYDHSQMTQYTIIANTDEEHAATMAIITDPSREIPQDSIIIEDA